MLSNAWPDLASAVPAAIAEVAGWSPDARAKAADQAADAIACGADALWADPTAGRAEISPAKVRDAIVTGLAVLAHRSRGVTFGGLHWHTAEHDGCPGPGTWALPAAATDRAARGAFFTPRALAEEITHYAVGPRLDGADTGGVASMQVCDPFCGSGAFLVAVARRLAAAHLALWDDYDRTWFAEEMGEPGDPEATAMMLALDSVYGVDIDPLPVELARLALALLIPHVDYDVRGVLAGDALVGESQPWLDDAATDIPDWPGRFDWPARFPEVFANPSDVCCGFDVVLGNPPYLGGQHLTGTVGRAYREHLIRNIAHGKRGSADLAVYCWLRMHELVNEVGTVGVIGPTNITRGANVRTWEPYLSGVGHRTVYRREEQRPWPSKSAAVACTLLYTAKRVWIPPEFTDQPDPDPGDGHAHTCGFNIDPPQLGEEWTPRPGCARCDALAVNTTAIIRIERDAQPYEIVRHRC